MAGRQPKLNKVLINKICKAIERGLTRKLTCAYVGIRECSFYEWLKEAEMINNALESGKELTEPMILDIGDKQVVITNALLKTELTESLRRSESKYLDKALGVISKALVANDVSTAKWILERRARDDFSTQQTVKVGNVEGETFKQEIHTKSREERFLEFQQKLKGLNLGELSREYSEHEKEQTEDSE
jgi:hypothetical protein